MSFSHQQKLMDHKGSRGNTPNLLDRAKALTMPALDLPSPDVIAGLIMLAFVDSGDNNEAGM